MTGEECMGSLPGMVTETTECGVCCNDDNDGTGFIMYSEADVHSRLSVYAENYNHFVCVKYDGGQWLQDTNFVWVAFPPVATDVLVASVDFSADTVTSLEGQVDMLNGMRQGYDSGDLVFSATDQIGAGGVGNVGEFFIDGSSFSRGCACDGSGLDAGCDMWNPLLAVHIPGWVCSNRGQLGHNDHEGHTLDNCDQCAAACIASLGEGDSGTRCRAIDCSLHGDSGVHCFMSTTCRDPSLVNHTDSACPVGGSMNGAGDSGTAYCEYFDEPQYESVPCQNHGICEDSYTCQCPAGYAGCDCENQHSEVLRLSGSGFSVNPFENGKTLFLNRRYTWIDVPSQLTSMMHTRINCISPDNVGQGGPDAFAEVPDIRAVAVGEGVIYATV